MLLTQIKVGYEQTLSLKSLFYALQYLKQNKPWHLAFLLYVIVLTPISYSRQDLACHD